MPYEVTSVDLDMAEVNARLRVLFRALGQAGYEPSPAVQAAGFAMIWAVARGEELSRVLESGEADEMAQLQEQGVEFIRQGMSWTAAFIGTPPSAEAQ